MQNLKQSSDKREAQLEDEETRNEVNEPNYQSINSRYRSKPITLSQLNINNQLSVEQNPDFINKKDKQG